MAAPGTTFLTHSQPCGLQRESCAGQLLRCRICQDLTLLDYPWRQLSEQPAFCHATTAHSRVAKVSNSVLHIFRATTAELVPTDRRKAMTGEDHFAFEIWKSSQVASLCYHLNVGSVCSQEKNKSTFIRCIQKYSLSCYENRSNEYQRYSITARGV